MKTKEKFLYREIHDDIISNIKNGTLNIGDKVPTEYELMETYDVCRITATRALNVLAEEGYIIRKRHSGSFVASTVNKPLPIRPAKSKKKLKHIALMLTYATALGGSDNFARFIQDAFYNQMLVSVFITQNDIDTERRVLKSLYDSKIDAVISIPVISYQNIEYYERLRIIGIPVLFVDTHIPWASIPYITFTNEASMYSLTKWVISQNFQKIAFFFSSEEITTESERLQGFLKALSEYRIIPHTEYLICIDENNSFQNESIQKQRRKRIHTLLEQYLNTDTIPEVIMCVNDLTAQLVIEEASALGISIPEQLSVTGFEGNSDINTGLVPALTTVRQDYTLFVKKIIETLSVLQKGIDIKEPIFVNTELIIRDSVKLKIKTTSSTSGFHHP